MHAGTGLRARGTARTMAGVPVEEPPDRGAEPFVVVPDDARDLVHDMRALERERRAERRRSRLRSLLLVRRGRLGVPPLLLMVVLALVSLVGSLVVVLHPQFGDQPVARPLADPAVPPGQVGGLLPDGPVTTPAGATTVRALPRPGVLVLVPVPCACDRLAAFVVDQSLQVSRHVRLVSTAAQDPAGAAVSALRRGAARGLVTSAVDEQGLLARTYGGTDASGTVDVVFVGSDGVVVNVVRDVREGQRLDAEVGRFQSHEREIARPSAP